MNIGKDLEKFFESIPPGEKTNAVYWLQKKVMKKALELPRDFHTKEEWLEFRDEIREKLPSLIGFPQFDEMKESYVRARIKVGKDVKCERVDIYVDEDYSIPTFVFSPLVTPQKSMPSLVWSPGWRQDKWQRSYQEFGVRMAKQGYVVAVFDHAPYGETTPYINEGNTGMTFVMSMGHLLGISQLALRAAENIRVGEYLRQRPDVDEKRNAIAGLCQGGMDTWLAAALDERFCAVAPIAAVSTFAIHMAEMASYRENGDPSPFPFGILNLCDIEHLHACIAPRPLLVRANLPDDWWPVSGFDDVEFFTRKIYRFFGAEDKVDFAAEVHEHDLTGPFADALEEFLLKYV
jgi:hypothetical protein